MAILIGVWITSDVGKISIQTGGCLNMITRNVTASDGVSREVVGKIFDDEFRIYRVHGDVTDVEALKETAQILAIELHVGKVVYTNI